ncbi:hypothetical protein M8J76_007577 [Diaphorina citri]|nr:hypothetical protein M8J76_007577 [Diaphorina citri]
MNEPPGGGAVPPPSCVAASDTRAAGQENSNVPVNDVECSRGDRKVLYDTDLSYEAYKVVVQLNRSSALKFLSKYKVGKTLAQFASYPNLIVELARLCRTKILIHCADAATANSLILSDNGSDEEFPSIANKDKRATQKEKLEKYVPPPLPYKSASETKRNTSNNITVSRPRKRDLNFEANTSMKKSKNPYSMFEHENLNTGAKVSDLFYEKCAERKLEQQKQQKTQVNLDNIANNPRRNLQSNKGFQFQNENINPSDIEMNFDFTKNSTQTSYLAASPLSPDFS